MNMTTCIHQQNQNHSLQFEYAWIEAGDRSMPSNHKCCSLIHDKIMTAMNLAESANKQTVNVKINLSEFDLLTKMPNTKKVLAMNLKFK